jgi:uncharacterized protein (TIGR03435 family)
MAKRWLVLVFLSTVVGVGYGFGQATTSTQAASASLPSFEVATIRRSHLEYGTDTSVNQNGNRIKIIFSGAPLRYCIQLAYNVKEYQISGPSWLKSERFDIVATSPVVPGDKNAWRLMLQSLLEERFKLTLHRETKVMPIYALVVGKKEVNLHAVDAKSSSGMHGTNNSYTFTGTSMPMFAEFLSGQTDRPVKDMTGLSGEFDFHLRYSDESMSGDGAAAGVSVHDMPAPGIYTALQEQLGLKLHPRRAEMQLLVIDHVEQAPTEN